MGFGAFFSAVSGLKGHLFSMSVVGNNIANANTMGFKTGRATFREALVQTLRGASPPLQGGGGVNPMQLGLGMEVSSIHSDLGQGMLQETGIVTDLAIEGEGFFVLNQGESRLYSRSGNFTFDAQGNLTSRGTSHIVQGWLADANGRIPTGAPTENIKLPFGQSIPGQMTTEVRFDSNLDASATTSQARLEDAGTTGIQVVAGLAKDGAGGLHQITITGANATQSMATGAHLVGGPLTGSETLTSLGVTDATIEFTVDGGAPRAVNGLTVNSTVGDLVNSINALEMGVTASIEGGEVKLVRDKYGDGSFFNATTTTAAAGNIARQVFGAAVGSGFDVNSGTSSTLAATGQFTPEGHPALNSVNLEILIDESTGLATGLMGVGGGGITITANEGLAAGDATIETESTEHLSSILLYDSLGNEHTLNMTFTRSGEANLWYWQASFDGGETIVGGRSGTVSFNTDGSLQSWLFDNGGDQMVLNPGPDADPMQISLFAGTPETVDGLTQYASPFTAKASSQDGFAMGALSSISIDNAGMITGFFTNGVLRNMGQVVLAKFNNSDGLDRVGGNLYRQSANSGDGIIGGARTTIPGSITSGALEMSNVDLSEEFVSMIVAQRGFQANARIITTGDEMMTDMINLKR